MQPEAEYLDKNIRNIIEPLIASLLMDRPKEPVFIILN
jgi:hypothetical protein